MLKWALHLFMGISQSKYATISVYWLASILFNQDCVCIYIQICKEAIKHKQYEWTDRLTLMQSPDML